MMVFQYKGQQPNEPLTEALLQVVEGVYVDLRHSTQGPSKIKKICY